jgi:hypothetical protein
MSWSSIAAVFLYGYVCARADSPGWLKARQDYPDFFAEPRNLVLGVCGDGVVPFDEKSTISFHFIVLCIYNLPPKIRTKRKNLLVYGVSESKPKNSQIIYNLLVDELLVLWTGVPTWDVITDRKFNLRAMLIMGIFDYPGLCDAMLRVHQGGKAGCAFCDILGVKVPAIKSVKYADHLHAANSDDPITDKTDEHIRAEGLRIQVCTI